MSAPRRFKQHAITLDAHHDAYLDMLAREWRRSRSEVVRMLIEEAVQNNPQVVEGFLQLVNRNK
jgi:predicted transcriptional regulator